MNFVFRLRISSALERLSGVPLDAEGAFSARLPVGARKRFSVVH